MLTGCGCGCSCCAHTTSEHSRPGRCTRCGRSTPSPQRGPAWRATRKQLGEQMEQVRMAIPRLTIQNDLDSQKSRAWRRVHTTSMPALLVCLRRLKIIPAGSAAGHISLKCHSTQPRSQSNKQQQADNQGSAHLAVAAQAAHGPHKPRLPRSAAASTAAAVGCTAAAASAASCAAAPATARAIHLLLWHSVVLGRLPQLRALPLVQGPVALLALLGAVCSNAWCERQCMV